MQPPYLLLASISATPLPPYCRRMPSDIGRAAEALMRWVRQQQRLAPAARQERNRRNPALAGSEWESTQALGIEFTAVGCDVAATSESWWS